MIVRVVGAITSATVIGISQLKSKIHIWLVVLTCSCLPLSVHAANWLTGISEALTEQDVVSVSARFGVPLILTTEFVETSDGVFQARADVAQEVTDQSWQFIEMEFEEDGRVIQRVKLEGSKKEGVDITLTAVSGYSVDTKPQLNTLGFSLSFIPNKMLSRFAQKNGSSADLYAVEVSVDSLMTSTSFPRELVRNNVIYTDPDGRVNKRIGFFASETSAAVALRQVRGSFPGAKIVPITAEEKEIGTTLRLFPATLINKERNQPQIALAARAVTPDTIVEETPRFEPEVEFVEDLDQGLLDEAQKAYMDKDWAQAISLYTKAAKDPKFRVEALEKLGVSRERNRQHAHAKKVYESFLDEYPNAPEASRVRQRLQSLVGATEAPADLRNPERQRVSLWKNSLVLSQFYRRYAIDIDGSSTQVPLDAVFSDVSAITRKRSSRGFHEGRISFGHILDFSDNDSQRDLRLQRVSWESFFERYQTGFTVGRQSRNKSGVLGRFDGATITHKQNDSLQWNVVGGYIARSAYETTESKQPFYGVSADLELAGGKIEVSPFFVQQYYDGILDRQAVGAHFFWVTDESLISALVDYDINLAAVNNLYLNGSYNLNEQWRVHGTLDQRRSPYLTTSNALIGQSYDDLSELERDLLDMKLGDLADDRTATSTVVRFGVDGMISDSWRLSVDASASDYSSTETSAGVTGFPDRQDYYVSTQLRANDLMGKNSYGAVQMRYQFSDKAETSTFLLNSRFAVLSDWFVYPRLMVSQRSYETSSQTQLRIKPSLRVDYVGFNRLRFEAEVGYDWNTTETFTRDIDMTGLFLRVGYRARF